ncbi:MAG: hypothetical protein OXO49_00155 [Gammaproteobacteria bacterium]|nr:hypothetical protein [Gammaproteobacteria bacterium]MDE0251397.1 hypothetical protein [Gammaproteobacteria bacterium]MDE0401920.1 hypothetical protein [Gammaproteobacteria bacterium]
MVNITEDMCRNGSADRVALHTFGYVFIGTSFVAMLVLVSLDMYLAGLIVASVLCGMAESRGRCGMSHIGTIAPMKSLDLNSWFKCSLAYTLCGTISAYLVGLLIVGLGSWIDLGKSVLYIGFSCLICVLFLLRESSLIRFNPPQCDHQTYKEWTAMFGLTTGVGMWGAHIGLALTTVITIVVYTVCSW